MKSTTAPSLIPPFVVIPDVAPAVPGSPGWDGVQFSMDITAITAVGGLMIGAITTLLSVYFFQNAKRERRAALQAAIDDRADARDERAIGRLEHELIELRVNVTHLWAAVNGYRRREYLWQGVRHGDVLQILSLNGIPADIPVELLTLPEFSLGHEGGGQQ